MFTDSTFFFFLIVSTFGRFPLHLHGYVVPSGGLLHAAVMVVILEPQAHLGSVFLKVKKLSGVKGSTPLPGSREDKSTLSQNRASMKKSCTLANNGHECCDSGRCKAFWEKKTGGDSLPYELHSILILHTALNEG